MAERLRACPFCASDDIASGYNQLQGREEIWCEDCGCTLSLSSGPQAELVAQWNVRVEAGIVAEKAWDMATEWERERCARIAEGPAEAWGEFKGGTPERDRIASSIRRTP